MGITWVSSVQNERAGNTASELTYSIALSAKAGAGRSRIPIAMLGTRYKGPQRIDITRAMLAQMVENFRKRDNGEIPIDYEHGTLDAAPGQPVPAAGWIKAIDDQPDASGILWGDVEWTKRAADMIAAKEYKYISPALDDRRDNKTGAPQGWTLTSAALTNTPVLQGMPALVLSEAQWTGERRRDVSLSNDFSDGSNTWDAVHTEMDRRAKALMAAKPPMGYQAAFAAVLDADPSLVEKHWNSLQLELGRRAKELMKNNSSMVDLGVAQRQVMIDDSHFARQYNDARRRWLGSGNGAYTAQSQADAANAAAELSDIVKQKIAASDGKLDYASAQQLVLSNRPDLRQRIITGMRGH